MEPIVLTVQDTCTLARSNCPVKCGVPFARGELRQLNDLSLFDQNRQQLAFDAEVLAFWDDTSIRWISIQFLVSLAADTSHQFFLKIDQNITTEAPSAKIDIVENVDSIIVKTGAAEFHIDSKVFRPFTKISSQSTHSFNPLQHLELIDQDSLKLKPCIDHIEIKANQRTVSANISLSGSFEYDNEQSYLNFSADLEFFVLSSVCKIDFTIHNSNAALHNGGFWDLGDPCSFLFRSLSFKTELPSEPLKHAGVTNLFDSNKINISNYEQASIHQGSSGGENWNHKIHVNADGEIPFGINGYQIHHEDSLLFEGNRVSPLVCIQQNDNFVTEFYLDKFWQNFPNAITLDFPRYEIQIFPPQDRGNHELQPGEKKTHCIYLSFGDRAQLEQFARPVQINLELKHYCHTSAMPWLSLEGRSSELSALIEQGLTGEDNFFNKREQADEYGWRNFGELWADHETLEHGNDKSLVSHYNNQYDPVYGFCRQYFLTGNPQWRELMTDLALHVMDIDVYDTDKDRPEYNNGLFWHTDHYLDASTCTHRTFSKSHLLSDHVAQSGGGPGVQHCYTTGLAYYYLMTGSKPALNTCLKMIAWINRQFNKEKPLLELTKDFITKTIPSLIRLMRGKNISAHSHPFNRGTGNYLNSLIDGYTLTADQIFLDDAANTIRMTIHPLDNIANRHLDDIEKSWSYTVFLQSVAKYIDCKITVEQFDEDFLYAYHSLKHYLDWICKNEYYYLERPERLEYANSTWAAQEIRKYFLLQFASQFYPDNTRYSDSAAEFLSKLTADLSKPDTKKSTRILAILMQNCASFESRTLREKIPSACLAKIENQSFSQQPPMLTFTKLASRTMQELMTSIKTFSLTKEINWIKYKFK